MAEPIRRLAAVMLTDIVGYSTSTQKDEPRALRLLEEHRRLVRPALAKHRGREVKTIGDAFLVEFESALDAIQCALEIQRTFFDRNRTTTSGRIELRIGVHAGDVVHEENDVYGDAINMVARIEPLAEPGGICVSGQVFEQVRSTIHLRFEPVDSSRTASVESLPTIYRIELPWLTPLRRGSVPLVGRDPELAILRRTIEAAGRADGRVLLVSGAAGIGKSRLVQEGSQLAEHLGWKVLWSRALPAELSAPYSPWVEILREFLRGAPPQLIDRVCGTFGSEIARLVPELAARVGPEHPPSTSDADEARLRLYDAVAQLFHNIAREAPLLLVVEDLQWADSGSLRLLQYFSRKVKGHRVAFVGTYRESDAEENPILVEVLGDLNRERLADFVVLKRLELADVARMFEQMTGRESRSAEFIRQLLNKTGGNPFFVEEVLLSLSEDGLFPEAWSEEKAPSFDTVRLPDTVRRVIQRRLARVDAPTTDVLKVASILGYDFSHDALQKVTGVDEERLSANLDTAVRTRVIEECRGGPGALTYSFTDRMVRDLLYDEQSAVRRRKYHLRAAHILEAQSEGSGRADATELAYHFLEGNDLGQALHYSLEAAEHARSVYARDEASRHYKIALEILDSRPDESLRASTLMLLSENERLTGDIELSLRHAEESGVLFEKLEDKRGAARAHMHAGSLYHAAYYDDPKAIEQFERARRALEGLPESVELGTVLLNLEAFGARGLPSQVSPGVIRRALEIGQRLNDLPLVIDARVALLWSTPPEQADSVSSQLTALEPLVLSGETDPSTLRAYYSSRGWSALLIDENSSEAKSWLDQGIARLRRVGAEPNAIDMEGQDLAQALLVLGEVGPARHFAEEAYEYAVRCYPNPDIPNLTVLAEIARMDGDLERSSGLLDAAYSISGRSLSVIMRLAPAATLTRLRIDQGRYSDALQVATDALAPVLESKTLAPAIAITDYAELLAMALEAASADGTHRRSEPLLEELRRIVGIAPRRPLRAFQLYAEGLWAASEGEPLKAVPFLEESSEIFGQLSWKPNLGRVLGYLARAYHNAGDEVRAKATQNRAVETFARMGAPGEASRWASLVAEPRGGTSRATT